MTCPSTRALNAFTVKEGISVEVRCLRHSRFSPSCRYYLQLRNRLKGDTVKAFGEKRSLILSIESYVPARLEATVSVLASAFVANPLHVRAFGAHQLGRNRLFFRIGVQHMLSGNTFIALAGGEVAGFLHFTSSPDCLPSPDKMPTVIGHLFKPLGAALPDLVEWFTRWSRLDPDVPHVHLGPLAVAPAAQRQGIGSALMTRYIRYLEEQQAAGYLETDRAQNIEFYQHFGFVVRREERLLETRTWYLWRPAASHPD